MENKEFDPVQRPSHYAGQGEIECIDFIEIMIKNYNGVVAGSLFNTLKYTWRTHDKNGKQDLEKALWYAKKAATKIELDKDISPCMECARQFSGSLTVEEELIIFKAVNQIVSKLTKEEADCYLTIVSCIINGGLNNTIKDYSGNMIKAIEKWIEIYNEK